MPDLHEWIDTAGGPFLLQAEKSLPSWRGTEGWTFETHGEDASDYSRACDTSGWICPIQCGEDTGYVLGGDVGPVSWITTQELQGGYFVQWLGVDDEAEILPALHSEKFEELLFGEQAEHISVKVREPGELRVIQAAEIGGELVAPTMPIKLRPGTYDATSVYLETTSLMIVVRRLKLQQCEASALKKADTLLKLLVRRS